MKLLMNIQELEDRRDEHRRADRMMSMKIMRLTASRGDGYWYRAYCLRCHRFVRDRRDSQETWRTKAVAVKHSMVHLEWHQTEDQAPLPERGFWKKFWPIIDEVSETKEK